MRCRTKTRFIVRGFTSARSTTRAVWALWLRSVNRRLTALLSRLWNVWRPSLTVEPSMLTVRAVTAPALGAPAAPPTDQWSQSEAAISARREREFEQHLYLVRKEIERRLTEAGIRDCYIPSFSSRNIVYKGLLSPSQLAAFYRDLEDPEFACSAALFHQRFSTNTSPSWSLAQPFRMVAHNGEINTLLGNRNWMRVREAVLGHPTWAEDVDWLKPVIQPGGSDSASFDNALELLSRSGRTVHHALLMMIPEAWESSVEIPSDVKAFYHYHSCLMEPWDGPP